MECDLKDIWSVEQEILDVIHSICINNKIRYSLFYGTLLGAVRHKGFIPWDDDIDIVMPRKDYDRFVKIWKNDPPEGYILQEYHEWDDLPNNFSKIRKDKTAFLQDEQEKKVTYHTGFFVDIFPMDRVAPTKIGRMIQFSASAVNLLYTRGYGSGAKGAIGVGEKILLKLPIKFRKPLLRFSEKIMTRWNYKEDCDFVSPCTIRACRKYFPSYIFKHMQLITFNEKQYMAVSDTNSVLKISYGDYMKLPPEEERVWKHHPIFVDFNHNYERTILDNSISKY